MPSPSTKRTNIKRLVELIRDPKKGIYNYSELITAAGISKDTFYKKKFNEVPEIIEAINDKVVVGKQVIKMDWLTSKEHAKQLCWFKLHGTPEEIERLQMTRKEDDASKGLILEYIKSQMNDTKQDEKFDKQQEEYQEKHQ